jgi:hypothetical protein
MRHQTRSFFGPFKSRSTQRITLDEKTYDKQVTHFTGKIFGISTDTLWHHLKLNSGVFLACGTFYLFFKGYAWLTQFSLATVGRLGFMGGFVSCAVLYSSALILKRRYQIIPNAVYNQALAIVLKDAKVASYLGAHPKTGEFKAYCATGGMKMPLPRRIRSGQYELADLIGSKPQRLQMMFILRSADGKEGLVSCDVHKSGSMFGTSASYYFNSLAVHLSSGSSDGKPATQIVIGKSEDIVYKGIMSL